MSDELEELDERVGAGGSAEAPVTAPDVAADGARVGAAPPVSAAAPETAAKRIRAAEDAAQRARLIALKAQKAAGKRPPGLAHGRWLGDFLDQDTETGLLPAEEKLLAAVGRGEVCDLRNRGRWFDFRMSLDEAKSDDALLAEIAQRLAAADTSADPTEDAEANPIAETTTAAPVARHEIAEVLIAETARWAQTHHKLAGITTERLVKEPALLAPVRGEVADRLQREIGWRSVDPEDRACRVRGPFLRFLALGGDADVPVHEKGVLLRGAFVTGDFDLQGCLGVCALGLHDCWFEVALVIAHAGIAVLSLQGSRVPGLQGDRADITGGVFLSGGFTAEGEVRLLGAKIGGQLNCIGGAFRNAGGIALDGDGAEITGDVFLSGGFTAEGEVRLLGAKIGGDLACIGGTFVNAVAQEGGGGNGAARTNAGVALNLVAAKIDGTLWLGPSANDKMTAVINGWLNLQGAHAHQVVDHPDFWPGGANSALIDGQKKDGKPTGRKLVAAIALDGFTYDQLVGQGKYDAETRLRWLARQPENHRIADFRPQPYEQLVKVLREMGHERDARIIAKARQDAERTARWHRNWPQKPFRAIGAQLERFFLGALAGYGYGSKRLIGMLLIIWLAGGLVYDAAERQGLMAPTSPIVFNDPKLTEACGGLGKRWTACEALPKEHTAFGEWFYSADVVTPIVSFDGARLGADLFAAVRGGPGKVQRDAAAGKRAPARQCARTGAAVDVPPRLPVVGVLAAGRARLGAVGVAGRRAFGRDEEGLSLPRPAAFGGKPGGAAGFGEFADAEDVALALGDGDHAAGVEQVEHVARLDALVVGGQRHQVAAAVARALLQQRLALGLGVLEVLEEHVGVRRARSCSANTPARPAGRRRRR